MLRSPRPDQHLLSPFEPKRALAQIKSIYSSLSIQIPEFSTCCCDHFQPDHLSLQKKFIVKWTRIANFPGKADVPSSNAELEKEHRHRTNIFQKTIYTKIPSSNISGVVHSSYLNHYHVVTLDQFSGNSCLHQGVQDVNGQSNLIRVTAVSKWLKKVGRVLDHAYSDSIL